jgi:hypothetical protein
MRTAAIVIVILLGAGGVAAAVALKPSGFDRCLAIVSADIERNASPGATLDPRDVEAEAARICTGAV